MFTNQADVFARKTGRTPANLGECVGAARLANPDARSFGLIGEDNAIRTDAYETAKACGLATKGLAAACKFGRRLHDSDAISWRRFTLALRTAAIERLIRAKLQRREPLLVWVQGMYVEDVSRARVLAGDDLGAVVRRLGGHAGETYLAAALPDFRHEPKGGSGTTIRL